MGVTRFVNSVFAWAMVSVAVLGMQIVEARELPDFTPVVESVAPAVVNISTSQKAKARANRPTPSPHGNRPDIPEGTPFDDFFRRFFGEEGPFEDFDSKSLGSGFIISADGYLLTNNHVIRDADEIVVRLSDRREFVAEVVGNDERSDVALLKINAKDVPFVKIGDSSNLKVGQWVIAIGSPFEFDHTVTAGIVSALGRNLPSENYVPFIQTDVAINPGNSGGPLINMDGEVVGVNAQIFSRTGGFMGLSFTIPIALAMDVVEQLRTKGHVSRGWLGVFIQDVTRELAESFGMDKPEGALVSRVMVDSPAAKSGFKEGDVIVEFDSKPVISSAALPPIVGVTEIGKKVPVVVLRDGKKVKLDTVVGELPPEDALKLSEGAPTKPKDVNRVGVVVMDLNKEQREKLEVKQGGVLVDKIDPDSPAMRAGMRRGDVVIKLNGEEVKDAKHFEQLVKDIPEGKNVAVLVQRVSGSVFLPLKIDPKGQEQSKSDKSSAKP